MNESADRPSRVPFVLAVVFALALSFLVWAAALDWFDREDSGPTTFGLVMRIVLIVDGGCCLLGAALLVLRQPLGRILTAVGGGVALGLPTLLVPAIVVAPVEVAQVIWQFGGPLVYLALILLGLLTMVQSLRRDTRAVVALAE